VKRKRQSTRVRLDSPKAPIFAIKIALFVPFFVMISLLTWVAVRTRAGDPTLDSSPIRPICLALFGWLFAAASAVGLRYGIIAPGYEPGSFAYRAAVGLIWLTGGIGVTLLTVGIVLLVRVTTGSG